MAGTPDDGGSEWKSNRLEVRERRLQIGRICLQSVDQCRRIGRGLGHSHANMRPCYEGDISEDHGPGSEHHAWRLEVEDSLYERLRRQANDLSELGREQSLRIATHCFDDLGTNLCRRYRKLVSNAIHIRKQVG